MEVDMLRNNKEDGFSPGSMLHLWTAQTDAVLDCIRENGFSQVKMEFIDKKYEESAWVFKEAYGFFKQRARLMVKPPEGAESPVWLFFDPGWVFLSPDSYLLELSVPRERVVLFDRERWQRVLNLSYVGKEQEDEARFEQKMNQMGVTTYWEVFQFAFYPYLKSEIKKSWERIFDIDNTEQTNLGAAVWQLRQEDVVGINSHSALEERDGFSGK
jgi:hypothetical protein